MRGWTASQFPDIALLIRATLAETAEGVMPKQDWRGHWLFGILDIWLTIAVGVAFFAWWRWGWTGVLVATLLVTLAIAAGLIIERRMKKSGHSN
jgi:hypothetical protein